MDKYIPCEVSSVDQRKMISAKHHATPKLVAASIHCSASYNDQIYSEVRHSEGRLIILFFTFVFTQHESGVSTACNFIHSVANLDVAFQSPNPL